MKLLEINNITKKDSPIYYRNEYSAHSNFILMGAESVIIPINFSIEMAPTGEKTIDIQVTDKIDYPLVPVLRSLREEIVSMEQKGILH